MSQPDPLDQPPDPGLEGVLGNLQRSLLGDHAVESQRRAIEQAQEQVRLETETARRFADAHLRRFKVATGLLVIAALMLLSAWLPLLVLVWRWAL